MTSYWKAEPATQVGEVTAVISGLERPDHKNNEQLFGAKLNLAHAAADMQSRAILAVAKQ